MSHTTTIKALDIKDGAAIEQAVAELQRQGVNCRLEKNTKPRMYYSRQEEMCDYVLRLDDSAKKAGKAYDVGFKKNKEGGYDIILDEWRGGVASQIGASCPVPSENEHKALHTIGKFSQQYARFAARNAATASGYMVEQDYIDDNGEVQLVIAVAD